MEPLDYITGIMCAIADKQLSSEVGFRGICKKVLVLMLVGVANIVDVHVVGTRRRARIHGIRPWRSPYRRLEIPCGDFNLGSALRGAVVCFYLSNEGLSLLENAAHLGLPVPDKLKDILAQLHNRKDKDTTTDQSDGN